LKKQRDLRKIFCSEVRGFQADGIILEEKAYFPEADYNSIVLPHKGNDFMWQMGITTPSTDVNFASRLSNIRDDQGRLITKTLMAGTACKSCRRMKRAAECTHAIKPPWKTDEGIAEIKAILAHDEATFNREIQGVVAGDDVRIYAQFVYPFRKQDPYQLIFPVHVIWSFIDPAGGGANSDFTIVSMVHENDKEVVSLRGGDSGT
jgi:hypothetical protein